MGEIEKTSVQSLFKREDVQGKFRDMLGAKSASFITSVLQAVSSNSDLLKADPVSVYNSAAVAAILDLPINNSIGHAYIVPFKTKQKDGTYKSMAQFQLGYKGLKQLAMRSGQFLSLHASDVREGELKKRDRLTGEITFEWEEDDKKREKLKVIGYTNYFKLLNGFESTYYMSIDEVNAHAKKYSQTFKAGFGKWVDDFDKMALKTVTKLHLNSGEAPLSTQMQTAIRTDQAIINDDMGESVEYADHEEVKIDEESRRITSFIEKAKTLDDLEILADRMGEEHKEAYNKRLKELQG